MRISDWSSDVCSSDLMFCAGGTSSGFSRATGAFAVLELRTRPKSVAGPLGPITMADLPSSSTTYWVARRKAEVLAAIDSGLLGIEDACRSEEHTSELKSLMRISYAVFCLKKQR